MESDTPRLIKPERLTAAAFAPFGDVIEAGDEQVMINYGQTACAADLAQVDVSREGGYPRVSLFQSEPLPRPITIRVMERHPLGSQMFYPLSDQRFLVVVAPAGDFDPTRLQAFVTDQGQGISYHAGVWHHFSLALNPASRFLVLDRGGPGNNTDERELDPAQQVLLDY